MRQNIYYHKKTNKRLKKKIKNIKKHSLKKRYTKTKTKTKTKKAGFIRTVISSRIIRSIFTTILNSQSNNNNSDLRKAFIQGPYADHLKYYDEKEIKKVLRDMAIDRIENTKKHSKKHSKKH